MRFQCEFPGCEIESDEREQFEYHHIVPRSKNGTNDRNNRIWLCLKHHAKIYIPGESRGKHSKIRDGSIIINGWRFSTGGRILEWKNISDKDYQYHEVEEANWGRTFLNEENKEEYIKKSNKEKTKQSKKINIVDLIKTETIPVKNKISLSKLIS